MLEPNATYVHNWHIDAICLPYNSHISTRSGPRAIGDIVESGWTGDVLSFNHASNQLEWRAIKARMKSRPNDLVSIVTSDGVKLTTTGNHPVFVKGRGYVPAALLRAGDIVFTVPELRWISAAATAVRCPEVLFEEVPLRARQGDHASGKVNSVQPLWQAVLSCAFAGAGALLRHALLWASKDLAGETHLSHLRTAQGAWQPEVLPGLLGKISAIERTGAVLSVWQSGVSQPCKVGGQFAKAWSVLRSSLLCPIHAGAEQPRLYRREEPCGLSAPLSARTQDRAGARWPLLLSVLEGWVARHPPHKSGQAGQQPYQSRCVVQAMPQPSKGHASREHQVVESTVSTVEREIRLPSTVYNVEVEGNNNYIADGILVHNCQHLEAVTDGRVTRLLINVPPGSMKSLLVSVLWPAWEWGPKGLRSMRYLTTAHNDKPVLRDGEKSLTLLRSEWYRALWPEVVLASTAVTSFGNTDTGRRSGVSFGSLMGLRGDRLILDDPHNVDTAESAIERANTTRRFREGALDRLNDKQRSAIVVIMQRMHEDDISGTILKFKMDYVHLMLPMEFEPERACETIIGFRDPRTYDGELLDPERVPRATVDDLKRDSTAYAIAGQYQQRPAPREGGMFKRHWFADKIVGAAPAGTKWVRHWDLAATAKTTAARTAGVKLGRTPDGKYVVGHVVKIQEEGNAVRKIILATAQSDTQACEISLPQDPGQAGKVQASDMIAMLAGFIARAEPETGDKITRAEPFASQCEAGNVSLVRGDWNESYIDELCLFPGGTFKDQVDASSGAFGRLAKPSPPQPLFGSYGR